MTNLELFKKLNLIIRTTGAHTNPLYLGLLDVTRPQLRDILNPDEDSVMAGSGDVGGDTCIADTRSNPMAICYLLNVCNEVLNSNALNKKDEFSLVLTALSIATDRIEMATAKGYVSSLGCVVDPLMLENTRMSEGRSVSNEIRGISKNYSLLEAIVEAAVLDNTNKDNSVGVERLDVHPLVCVLFSSIRSSSKIKNLVMSKILQHPMQESQSEVAVTASIEFEKLKMLGFLDFNESAYREYHANRQEQAPTPFLSSDFEYVNRTFLGQTHAIDFERAMDIINEPASFNLSRTWYIENIESVRGLDSLLLAMRTFDPFPVIDMFNQIENLERMLVNNDPNKKGMPMPKRQDVERKIEDLKDKIKKTTYTINSGLEEIELRTALVRHGLVVRNPLQSFGNPSLILSGFGHIVAHKAYVNQEVDVEQDL